MQQERDLSKTLQRPISHVLRVAPAFRLATSPVPALLAVALLAVALLLLPCVAAADRLAAQSRTGSVAASSRTFHRQHDRRISHTQHTRGTDRGTGGIGTGARETNGIHPFFTGTCVLLFATPRPDSSAQILPAQRILCCSYTGHRWRSRQAGSA